jgi:hypothetical protein
MLTVKTGKKVLCEAGFYEINLCDFRFCLNFTCDSVKIIPIKNCIGKLLTVLCHMAGYSELASWCGFPLYNYLLFLRCTQDYTDLSTPKEKSITVLLNNNKFSLFYSILSNIIFITIHQYDNTVRLMLQFFIL